MEQHLKVRCECEDTGYIAVSDPQGEDTEYVECAAHNPAFNEQALYPTQAVITPSGEGKIGEFNQTHDGELWVKVWINHVPHWFPRNEVRPA